MIRRACIIPLLAAVLASMAGCSSAFTPAAAVVNGEKIGERAVQDEVDAVRSDENFQELLRSQGPEVRGVARRNILSTFIRVTVQRQEASRRGMKVSSKQIDDFIANLK